ncbi:MAG: hypothetical protein KI792_06390 [Alphaproteobacteria bacterium]|nr:hypothetical protein [Alphaproteobacteria bacterium SS10]
MRLRALGVLLLAAVGLSGCLGANYGTGSTRTFIDPVTYNPEEKGYAGEWNNYMMARRNVNTEIHGNPFNMDKEVFDLVAAQVMTERQTGPKMFFQPKVWNRNLPGEAAREQYNFIIVFNPTASVTGQELCAGAQVPTIPSFDKRLVIRTAFCRYGEYVVGATTERFNVGDVRDQDFSKAVSNVLSATFPRSVHAGGDQSRYDRRFDTIRYHGTLSCERLGTCSPYAGANVRAF